MALLRPAPAAQSLHRRAEGRERRDEAKLLAEEGVMLVVEEVPRGGGGVGPRVFLFFFLMLFGGVCERYYIHLCTR